MQIFIKPCIRSESVNLGERVTTPSRKDCSRYTVLKVALHKVTQCNILQATLPPTPTLPASSAQHIA